MVRFATRAQEKDLTEGIILERTATALQLVVRELPPEAGGGGGRGGRGGWKGGGRGGRGRGRGESGGIARESKLTFCLTRHVSGVPYERCAHAITTVADPV